MRMLLATLAVCALVVAACGGGDDEQAATPPLPDTPAGAGTMPTGLDEGDDRSPAPPVAGTSLAGDRVSLEDFAGRPVLVNVWSSW